MSGLLKFKENKIEEFFYYSIERYKIMLQKHAGKKFPWTDDKIFHEYRFCNIFREDDTVTKYIRQNINESNYGDKIVDAMVIARWFNRISSIKLIHEDGALLNLDTARIFETLNNVKGPIITGSYVIPSPNGLTKLMGITQSIEEYLRLSRKGSYNLLSKPNTTLETAHKWFCKFNYIGKFMAYEIVTDLRHSVLSNASDINSWASAGPGAARGLSKLCGLDKNYLTVSSKTDSEKMTLLMKELLYIVNSSNSPWKKLNFPDWEMREVEHTLCEYDKYTRVKAGEGRPRQKFRKGDYL